MAAKNPIWNFFDKNEDKATCKICSKILSLGSSLPKKQTITNIKNHLDKIHKEECQTYVKLYNKYLDRIKVRKVKNMKTPHESVKSQDVMMQSTLPQIMEQKIAVWPDDHPISLCIDKSIMDFIIVDMLPYNIVEGDGFQRLNIADPNSPSRYQKKSEKFFRTSLMPATYDKVKKKVFDLVSKAEWISFTTNIWSNPKTCSLLSFTAHFIEGPTRLKVILGAMVLDEDHTGSFIAKKLTKAITEYQIENKIHMAIRNNAANMSAALRIGNFKSLRCVAHTLQFVINDSIFKDEEITILIKKCRKIVGHFKKSEQADQYLHQFQETCGLPKHALIQDVETRWNSIYLMMERLFEQKVAINLYMAERGEIDVPTVEEWNLINHLITVLKCFYQATLDISADSACVSLIIPLTAMLNAKLAVKTEDSKEIRKLKQRLSESVNKRFFYIKNCSELTIATIIDPRFKTKYLTDDEITNCKAKIKTFLFQEFRKTLENTTKTTDKTAIASTSSDTPTQETDNLWDMHDNMPVTFECPDSEDFLPFDEHLQSYLKEPLLKRNADIFHYWASSPYTYLKKVATKYLSAPPTSVASEQLFSVAGQIYANKRVNLLDENVNKLLFLAYNIKLFNFEY